MGVEGIELARVALSERMLLSAKNIAHTGGFQRA